MKKLLLSLAFIGFSFAFDKILPDYETNSLIKDSFLENQIKKLKKIDPSTQIIGVKKENFYILEIKSQKRGKAIIYITADKKYIVIGSVLDRKNGTPLMPDFPKNKEIIKEGVLFTIGEGEKELYVITDPECPYCRLMEKEKGEELYKNYKVHIILYPLPFHKNAKAMSYYILSGKNNQEKAERFKEVLAGSEKWKDFSITKQQKELLDKELEKAKKAAEELEAKGTPSIYDKNFKALNWTDLGGKK